MTSQESGLIPRTDMMSPDLENESRIVWLRDPRQFTYLREMIIPTRRRRGRIHFPDANLAFVVGYSEIRSDVPSDEDGLWYRRIWWLRTYDYDLDPTGVYSRKFRPEEAVHAGSIRPGELSNWYRAEGGEKDV